ncbi:hypothetical protein RCL_jg1511.t1 [Rhizophagus clarus]|uniref:Uncharacterized protein n=2 Tax=Rhizophagus clarus TaxID=94130 RepID=A0A8H3QJP4_9GLOM|nr:hypothetical protein RCL_jg1511.t1 [Rhizophagus clarus]
MSTQFHYRPMVRNLYTTTLDYMLIYGYSNTGQFNVKDEDYVSSSDEYSEDSSDDESINERIQQLNDDDVDVDENDDDKEIGSDIDVDEDDYDKKIGIGDDVDIENDDDNEEIDILKLKML